MTREEFTNLILDSEQTLYCVAMSMLRNEKDCEDAVQTAILTAYEKLGTLKQGKARDLEARAILQNMAGAYPDKCLQQAAQVSR